MIAILSADRNWGIGRQGKLLVSIPSDMRFFRDTTMGNVVVMGRKTLQTMPGGQPLKGRTNIVLTRDSQLNCKDAIIVHSEKELLEELKKYPSDRVYVVGGGEIYRMLLPYCDKALVTKIDMEYEADTYFPNLDADEAWEQTWESEEQTCFDIEFYFTTYCRKANT